MRNIKIVMSGCTVGDTLEIFIIMMIIPSSSIVIQSSTRQFSIRNKIMYITIKTIYGRRERGEKN